MPPRRSRLTPLSPGSSVSGPPVEPPFILPRQPGESAYAYRYRRTVALYGQTPYQRRIFLGQQRGLSVSSARGYRVRGGETESQRRNRLSVEQYGQTVSQRRTYEARAWLELHGYTPEDTQMSWTNLIRLEPRLRYMMEQNPGSTVTPEMIYYAIELEHDEELPKGWAFNRIWEKYDAMVSYRVYADKNPGRAEWQEYLQIHPYIPDLAPQWWYYH